MNPFFSIVIPTYNRASLVEESIQSVLAQSFTDFEIVIIDDGSTDDTEQIVKAILSPQLIYFKKANGERGAARNVGIDMASGEYIVFMDSDDYLHENHLQVLYNHLKNQPENFIATRYTLFKGSDEKDSGAIKHLSSGYHTYQTFLIGNPLACCFTIKKKNSSLIKFREELKYTIMEDWIFLMENLHSSRLYLMDDVTMRMRDHEMRSMRGSAEKIINARKNALMYLIESFKFSGKEKKLLIGHSEYFCAIHAYIGGSTSQGFQYLKSSVAKLGFSKNAFLLLLKLSLQVVWVRKEF